MWEPQPLTTLRASKACTGENFTFYLVNLIRILNGVFLAILEFADPSSLAFSLLLNRALLLSLLHACLLPYGQCVTEPTTNDIFAGSPLELILQMN
jgi:hypothetical protein